MVLGPVTDNQDRIAYSSYVMLERMAVQALAAKDYFAAFKYADRR
ncbi:MAG: glycosyl transferase, family 2 [Nitrobacter vulgaris]|nr:glycosyl transferase, family 2 [Nitrobacter vulgaris]